MSSNPIPPEVPLDRAARVLRLHPISICALLWEGIQAGGWRSAVDDAQRLGNALSLTVLQLLGHRWPHEAQGVTSLDAGEGADPVIPLTDTHGAQSLANRVADRLFARNRSLDLHDVERILGSSLGRWLEKEFQLRHIRQFRNRPIAWQVQTRPTGRSDGPIFSCLIHCQRLAGTLPNVRSRYAGKLRASLESELRTLDILPSPTADQAARKARLAIWIDELKELLDSLEAVESSGFATAELRKFGIDDAVHSMTRRWLRLFRDQIRQGPLAKWRDLARTEGLPPELASWISEAVDQVDLQCVALAPTSPPDAPDGELTAIAIADLFRGQDEALIRKGLEAICRHWAARYDREVLTPVRQKLKTVDHELKTLQDNLENKLARKALRSEQRKLKQEIADLAGRPAMLDAHVKEWVCPEAQCWPDWLAAQPLYDEISSLDGRRRVPTTLAEFVAQESQYQPDINDGVRVNIAPLQKSGVLMRDVLDPKDVERAIADRAEWRADERRWARQGILDHPGWWQIVNDLPPAESEQ